VTSDPLAVVPSVVDAVVSAVLEEVVLVSAVLAAGSFTMKTSRFFPVP